MKPRHQQSQANESTKAVDQGCGISRREFLGGCVACAAGLSAMSAAGRALAEGIVSEQSIPAPGGEKPKIRLVFTHIPPEHATWPNIGFDYEGRKQHLVSKLREACPDIEFLPATLHDKAEAQTRLLQLRGIVKNWVLGNEGLTETGREYVQGK